AEVNRAKERAERANRAKDEFLAVMSHEMRTPLNPIVGFGALLRDQIEDPDQREYLDLITAGGERLSQLIDRILTYCRFESSEPEMRWAEFDLVEFCRDELKKAGRMAPHLEWNWENGDGRASLPLPEPFEIRHERTLLREVLGNLLDNAAKFTPKGSVTLRCGEITRSGERILLCFEIIDTGPGIDPKTAHLLFQPFQQADFSTARPYEGLGLGLATCHRIVAFLGGEINVRQADGGGAHFWFTLPVSIVNHHTAAPEALEPLATTTGTVKVLIAEDNAGNLRLAEILVRRLDALPLSAANGAEAVELARQKHFDLVLMDLSMPVMDGVEAAEAIRKDSPMNSRTPIIALTAHVTEESRRRCLEAGFSGFIAKPFRLAELIEQFTKHIPKFSLERDGEPSE
ncbi:MAG: response regulator, partial [Opitutales bacterium]